MMFSGALLSFRIQKPFTALFPFLKNDLLTDTTANYTCRSCSAEESFFFSVFLKHKKHELFVSLVIWNVALESYLSFQIDAQTKRCYTIWIKALGHTCSTLNSSVFRPRFIKSSTWPCSMSLKSSLLSKCTAWYKPGHDISFHLDIPVFV